MVRAPRRALLLALLLGCARAGFAAEWIEVRSAHFRVIGNAGVKRVREVAGELERIRLVFRSALVNMPQDPKLPILAFAVRNEASLRDLLPGYWERKGAKPAGVFRHGQDKHYIVVRVDSRAEERYRIVYHEYFHLLLSLNLHRLPVWLNEGLAEFWEQTVVRGNQVNMGLPNPGHLDLLYRQSMVPLREILSMETNPHVSDPDRVGIFYAQAWALTHFLMLGGNAESLGKYIGMVEDGGDPWQAFVSVFGPIEEMEKELERYVRQTRMRALKMKAPEKIDAAAFTVAPLSEADSAAARGNFLVSGDRPDAALPHLERALALAPANALALESMGIYYYHKHQHDQAREWFSKAANVNSESFLCHYYLARLLMEGGGEGVEQAKESLRRAIALNPSFAPAYADLGRLYVSTGIRLESAYGVAAKAADLAPDNAWNWLNVGQILLQMGKLVEARAAAERASRVARTDALQALVERFREEIEIHAKRDEEIAVEAANPPPAPPIERGDAPPIENRFGRLREGDRRIEGRFTELRCERLGTFSFVVVSEGRTHVFHTETPKEIQLVDKGESVIRDLRCGPQDVRVAVIYTPSGNQARGDGELRVLEFLR